VIAGKIFLKPSSSKSEVNFKKIGTFTSVLANKVEDGGLSGQPLFKRNLELVKWAYQQTNGKFLIIGSSDVFVYLLRQTWTFNN
jgi:dihydroorotate dehydrogenase